MSVMTAASCSGNRRRAVGLNYGYPFSTATLVTVPGATHGLGHRALRCQVYDDGTPRQRLKPGLLMVDPTTFDVTLQFLGAPSGLVVLQGASAPVGALGNKSFPFSVGANGVVTVTGAQHAFGTDHLLVDVYDNGTPRLWMPDVPVTVHPGTFDVTAAFLQPQAGVLVLSAAADTGTANQSYPLSLAAGGSTTIGGATHGFGTANLGVQVYDTLGHEVVPGAVGVHPSTFALTIHTLAPLTGTLVLNGSVASVSGPRMVIARGGALLMGGASQGQNTTGLELTTGYYTFSFVDDAQQAVEAALIESLQCTLYDAATGQVVNSRFHQNVRNANQGTLTTTAGPPMATTFELELLPVDTAMLDQGHSSEQRVLLFQWTWAGGQRAGAHQVSFVVNNLTFVP
jgi:hypothetical protein